MYLRTLLIVIVIAIVVMFTFMNWAAFVSQTTLSFGFTTLDAPLGLILLGVTGVLTLLFLIYLVYLQSSVLLESRRYSRELQTQREVAENAEASRLKQLQSVLESELRQLGNQTGESRTAILARLDELDRDLRASIEQSGNSVAAYIGEFEDRLERSASGKTKG